MTLPKLISDFSDVDLNWLQSVLKRNFPSNAPAIDSFVLDISKSSHAKNAVIKVTYKDQTTVGYPESFFLKICHCDTRIIVESEPYYYTRDYARLTDSPIPRCYDAQFSESGTYHILMEDLSSSHYSNKDIDPTPEHAAAVARSFAKLHAHRWGEKVQSLGHSVSSSTQISRFIDKAVKGLNPILHACRDTFSQESLEIIRLVFEKHPEKMLERSRLNTGKTLLHGDANPSNILSPIKPSGKTYIIDRQPFTWSITYWLGVFDLAYMAIPYWNKDDRERHELSMLEQYQKALVEFGVVDYPWELCKADYRLCVPYGIYVAVAWGASEESLIKMRWLWEAQLQRSIDAFHDWNCKEDL